MNNLGKCYENGNGCVKNERKAYENYRQAAHLGNLRGNLLILSLTWFS